MVFATHFHLGVSGQLLVLVVGSPGVRMLTYSGEDSPVLGGEVAESFGVELHGGRLLYGIGVGT